MRAINRGADAPQNPSDRWATAMNTIAQILGNTLSAILVHRHPVHLENADRRMLDDLRLDSSAVGRARFQSFRMGEPGASNAARLGVNGR